MTTVQSLSFMQYLKATLASRDASYYWGPVLQGTARLAEIVFPMVGGASQFIDNVVGDARAFDGVTFSLVDAPAMLRTPREWTLSPGNIFGFFFQASDITSVQSIRCEVTGHCPTERESAATGIVGLVGDISKLLFTTDTALAHRADLAHKDEDKTLGVPLNALGSDEYKRAWTTRKTCDFFRYTIWYVTAGFALGYECLAAQGNVLAKAAGAFSERYAFTLIANSARGALGLASFILGKQLLPISASTENGECAVISAARAPEGERSRQVYYITQNDMQATEGTAYTNFIEFAQYIASDRVLTRSFLKPVRAILMVARLSIGQLGEALGNKGYQSIASNLGSLDGWIKKRYAFAKLCAAPAFVQKVYEKGASHYSVTAKSVQFWGERGFDFTYDLCAIPGYLWNAAGAELPGHVSSFLNEAKSYWCGLFMGAALVAQFGYDNKTDYSNKGARAAYTNGAQNAWNYIGGNSALNNTDWRDTAFFVDRTAVICMTGLTLYNWTCDIRGKKWEAFSSTILIFDAIKAVTTLFKKRYEDKTADGFLGQQAAARLKWEPVSAREHAE